MSEVYVVAGRRLVAPSTMTYRRHLYITKQVHEAGLDRGESIDPWTAVDPSRAPTLLAGFLVPELPDGAGETWSMAEAARLADWFGDRVDAADHVALDQILLEVLASFFGGRGRSSVISPTSSTPAPVAAPAPLPAEVSEGTPI